MRVPRIEAPKDVIVPETQRRQLAFFRAIGYIKSVASLEGDAESESKGRIEITQSNEACVARGKNR